MFGVYLITEYPVFRDLLWTRIFDLTPIYSTILLPLVFIGQVLFIVAVCSILDLLRIGLFNLTIDRHKGGLFDKVCRTVTNAVSAPAVNSLTASLKTWRQSDS
jgi:hypothetical protein